MRVKIWPRSANDRGGYACMPMKKNIPQGKSDWELTTCPECKRECLGNAALENSIITGGNCSLHGMRNSERCARIDLGVRKMDNRKLKFCPDLTQVVWEKAMMIGDGDYQRIQLNECIMDQCVAYCKEDGKCHKYMNEVEE